VTGQIPSSDQNRKSRYDVIILHFHIKHFNKRLLLFRDLSPYNKNIYTYQFFLVSPTSQSRTTAMLVMLITECQRLPRWGV